MTSPSPRDIAFRLERGARDLLREVVEKGVAFVPRLNGPPFQLMAARLVTPYLGDGEPSRRGYRLEPTPTGKAVYAEIAGPVAHGVRAGAK